MFDNKRESRCGKKKNRIENRKIEKQMLNKYSIIGIGAVAIVVVVGGGVFFLLFLLLFILCFNIEYDEAKISMSKYYIV